MLITFDKLLLDCIHDSSLHNRLRENHLRGFFSTLIQGFSEYNDKTLAEVRKMRNCHFADYGVKIKITDFFAKYAKKSEVKAFVSDAKLYQLAIPDTEIRLIGDLKRNYFQSKEPRYNDLFSILFIDFDHSLHQNVRKLKAKKDKDLICIMSEKDC